VHDGVTTACDARAAHTYIHAMRCESSTYIHTCHARAACGAPCALELVPLRVEHAAGDGARGGGGEAEGGDSALEAALEAAPLAAARVRFALADGEGGAKAKLLAEGARGERRGVWGRRRQSRCVSSKSVLEETMLVVSPSLKGSGLRRAMARTRWCGFFL
jgi:hypothetical protein